MPTIWVLLLSMYVCLSERGREGRLIRLLSDTRAQSRGVQYGIGVDEDTALVVYDVNTTQATGEVSSSWSS